MSEKKLAIKEKVKQLDDLIAHFEESADNFDIDSDLKKYEQAMKLVAEVRKELESVELKITEIKAKYEDS